MIKTSCQFSASTLGVPASPSNLVATTFRQRGIAGFYSGCGALVVGNSAKAGVRFLSYDTIKDLLKNKETGKLSTSGSILAGMTAGACEAAFAVTPSETVKTKLIDDARRAHPRFTGTMNGVAVIVREEGIAGIYRGLGPTIVKQSANSAVRFTCKLSTIVMYQVLRRVWTDYNCTTAYNTLVGLVQSFTGKQGKLPSAWTFACGAGAGVITVYTTMPFDVIKTRLQGLEASKYSSSFDCFRRVIAEDGVKALWGGSVARLSRLMVSVSSARLHLFRRN